MPRATIITAMKDEGPYLLEWLAYHRMIGFDHFIVVTNDCSDGIDAMLDILAAQGGLTHLRNDRTGPHTIQWSALRMAEQTQVFKDSDWVLVLDVDEFVNIKTGDGQLDDLFAVRADATAFALQWRLFGNNGVYPINDTLLISEFTKSAPFPVHFPWQASLFKTLFRNDGSYAKLGVHRPDGLIQSRKADQVWVNGGGRTLPSHWHDNFLPLMGEHGEVELVQINHYALRSAQGFLVKSERGLPNRSTHVIDAEYWVQRNFNAVQDRSILRHSKRLKAAKAALLDYPRLQKLHTQALNWHRKQATKIELTEKGMFLLNACMTSETKVLSSQEASFLNQKLAAMNEAKANRQKISKNSG